jgi:hypothetical protein
VRNEIDRNDRRRDLIWRGDNLCRVDSTIPLMSIAPDSKYAGMWRVKSPSGKLTDMVNRARAKDAAEWIVFEISRGAVACVGAPPMRSLGKAAA